MPQRPARTPWVELALAAPHRGYVAGVASQAGALRPEDRANLDHVKCATSQPRRDALSWLSGDVATRAVGAS
jgi:hypothetical protein